MGAKRSTAMKAKSKTAMKAMKSTILKKPVAGKKPNLDVLDKLGDSNLAQVAEDEARAAGEEALAAQAASRENLDDDVDEGEAGLGADGLDEEGGEEEAAADEDAADDEGGPKPKKKAMKKQVAKKPAASVSGSYECKGWRDRCKNKFVAKAVKSADMPPHVKNLLEATQVI